MVTEGNTEIQEKVDHVISVPSSLPQVQADPHHDSPPAPGLPHGGPPGMRRGPAPKPGQVRDGGMRVVLQRVSRASVSIMGKVVGEIGQGLVLLVGFTEGDDGGPAPLDGREDPGPQGLLGRGGEDESLPEGCRG